MSLSDDGFGADVYRLIIEGDGYLAAEKAMVHVRRLRRDGDDVKAMIFLMEVALSMCDKGMGQAAALCAKRSIELFPHDATTINRYLSNLFHTFATRATPDMFCQHLSDFFSRLIMIFPREIEQHMSKQAAIACEAGSYYESLQFYLVLMSSLDTPEKTSTYSDLLAKDLIPPWLASLPDPDYETQFVIAKTVLGVATVSQDSYKDAQRLFDSISPPADLPLLNFTRFYLRALSEGHAPSLDFLCDRYSEWLAVDVDLNLFAKIARRKRLPPPQQTNPFMQMMNSFLGAFA